MDDGNWNFGVDFFLRNNVGFVGDLNVEAIVFQTVLVEVGFKVEACSWLQNILENLCRLDRYIDTLASIHNHKHINQIYHALVTNSHFGSQRRCLIIGEAKFG